MIYHTIFTLNCQLYPLHYTSNIYPVRYDIRYTLYILHYPSIPLISFVCCIQPRSPKLVSQAVKIIFLKIHP